MFENAWGNRPQDERFHNLAEETVAKILQSEWAQRRQDKGEIHIKKLIIQDGQVGQQKIISAGKGEKKEFDTLTVTVEDKGMFDVADTDFDCGKLIVDEIDNRLKPRKRPGGGCGQKSRKSLIEIPVQSDSPLGDMLNDNPFNGNQSPDGDKGQDADPDPGVGEDDDPSASDPGKGGRPDKGKNKGKPESGAVDGHLVDLDKLKQAMRDRGYDHFVEEIGADEFSDRQTERVIQGAIKEAEEERKRIGVAYPGGHCIDYCTEVVRPARAYSIVWRRRVREMLLGEGPDMTRSMDELSVLSLVDPKDMGFDGDDEFICLPGVIPQKPLGRMLIYFDSSGSMDTGRLSHAATFLMSCKPSGNDTQPDVDFVCCDTAMRGAPTPMTDEKFDEFLQSGVAVAGRGGTEITVPLNQIMAWAEKNEVQYDGIVIVTDFGFSPPDRKNLPEKLPSLMFLGIPNDYAQAEPIVKALEEYAEVAIIDKNMELDMTAAEDKAEVRGEGLKARAPRP
jgi:hypothetical protein